MGTFSQRMSGNNDLMDPDWKPETKVYKSDPIEKITELIRACDEIFGSLERGKIDLEADYYTRVTLRNDIWRKFVSAYKDVMFKEDKATEIKS